MMWDDGYWAWWMWVPALLLPLLVVGGIVVVIVLLVRMPGSSNTPGFTSDSPGLVAGGPAKRILGERLARGEISVEEYRERLRALDEGDPR